MTEYHSENGNIVYLVGPERNDSERNYFVVSSKSGFALSRYTASEKSEKNMLALVKNYISSFIDMKDIDDDYVYSCTTAVIVTNPVIPSTWKEFKAGYYVPKNDSANKEEVSYYEFRFDKYHNGYQTGDCISVRCSSTGDIENLIYSNYGVDWSCFPINEDKLNNKIASYLHNAVSDEYEIIEYELIDNLLTYDSDEKQAKLRLTYKVTVEKNGEKIETKCLMVVRCK